ncbi:alpha-ketoacid dehydrogenase subunit beta [Candidatus Omnitrophota bacterium]
MSDRTTYLQSLNRALSELLQNNDKVILFGEDIRDPYGGAFKVTKGLSAKFPNRIINTPISEASITGLATGMALRGFKPILEIMFGDFITLCTDQIVNHASKFSWIYNNKVEVNLTIRTPMGGRRGYGPTHSQTLEKLFFCVPGIKIIAPSLYHDIGNILKEAVNEEELVLFIENKLDYPKRLKLSPADYDKSFTIKKSSDKFSTVFASNCNFTDPDVTIITYGGMVGIVELAVLQMAQYGIKIDIIIPSIIKPVPFDEILMTAKNSGRLIIAEEGTLTNGWGAELSALIAENGFEYLKSPIKRVAALDLPIANSKSLENEILPNEGDIKEAILEVIE